MVSVIYLNGVMTEDYLQLGELFLIHQNRLIILEPEIRSIKFSKENY